MSSPYDVLGVPPDASSSAIRKAYHRLALLHHPDKLPATASDADRAGSEAHFKAIAAAYEVLSDPASRAAFDAGGGVAGSWSPSGRSSRDIFRDFFGATYGEAAAGSGVSGISIETREADIIFNLPLFEGFLVLDPRPSAARAAMPVFSALPCDPATLCGGGSLADDAKAGADGARERKRRRTAAWEAWFAEANDDFSHDRTSPVVVLGDAGGAELAASLAEFLASPLTSHAAPEGVGGAAAPPSPPPPPVSTTLRLLRSSCRRIVVSNGGAAALVGAFPLLSRPAAAQRPTPHAIAPGVFLGSRVVPWEASYLVEGLGISHAVVADGDAAVAEELPGIARLAISIPDSDEAATPETLRLAWTHACAFIDAALAAGGRVYIAVHGRSRGASVALAWIARSHALPVAAAARILFAKVPAIDWGLAFAKHISDWLGERASALAE